jgi:iron-sulfur cluster assembly protein CyaY
MDESTYEKLAKQELAEIEDRLMDVDPDDVEITVSEGILRLDLRDGVKIVVNSHRAARQIWMAAVSTAWHFDPSEDGRWRTRAGDELRETLMRVVKERLGLELSI